MVVLAKVLTGKKTACILESSNLSELSFTKGQREGAEESRRACHLTGVVA